jgi:hypothetical protein
MKLKRALTALSVIAAAGVVPLVTAAPAQADQIDCVNYLSSKGYQIGPRVRSACSIAAWPLGVANPACVSLLVNIQVTLSHAGSACKRA